MKKQKQNFMLMMIALACVLNSTNSNAQSFTAAGLTENTVAISGTRKVGSDILDNGNDTYRVCTYADGSSRAKLVWRVNYSGTLYASETDFAHTSNITEHDVCLVIGGSDIYALVVYSDASAGKVYYEYFKWNTSSLLFVTQSSSTLQSFVTSNNAANIDADENGNFIMVWDDNGTIYGQYGIISSAVPALNGTVSSMASGISPDVAIYDPSYIYVAYNDGVSKMLVDKFSSSLGAGTNELTTSGYNRPRIACPNQQNGSAGDWTAVTEDVITGTPTNFYEIVAYVSQSASIAYTIDCNDGSFVSTTLDGTANFEPVITYDSESSNTKIWIAWTFDNSAPTYITGTTAVYPVAVAIDIYGNSVFNAYLNVPTSPTLTTGDARICPSLAGRHSSSSSNYEKLLVSYFDDLNNYLIIKGDVITSTALSLRTANSGSSLNATENEIRNLFALPQVSGTFSLSLFDLSGRIVLSATGDNEHIKERFFDQTKNLDSAVYFAELISDDNSIKRNSKIFISNK